MIDRIDRLILKNIFEDASISNLKLAKNLGINAATVAKRIDAMLKNEMISIKAVQDLRRFKVKAFITLNVDLMSIDKLKTKLTDSTAVRLAVATFGRFDILTLVHFLDWDKFNSFMQDELGQWPGVVHSNVFLVAETKAETKNAQAGMFGDLPAIPDETDIKIIAELSKNALISNKDLASRLRINPATISRRVSALLGKKIIKIVAIPNAPKFGYSANAFLMLGTNRAQVEEIINELDKFPEVHVSMALTNGYNIFSSVRLMNPELLYEFIKGKVARIRGITTIETLTIAESIKATFAEVDLDNLP
jgi:DNA-binding Lrp family transcriptional regulator